MASSPLAKRVLHSDSPRANPLYEIHNLSDAEKSELEDNASLVAKKQLEFEMQKPMRWFFTILNWNIEPVSKAKVTKAMLNTVLSETFLHVKYDVIALQELPWVINSMSRRIETFGEYSLFTTSPKSKEAAIAVRKSVLDAHSVCDLAAEWANFVRDQPDAVVADAIRNALASRVACVRVDCALFFSVHLPYTGYTMNERRRNAQHMLRAARAFAAHVAADADAQLVRAANDGAPPRCEAVVAGDFNCSILERLRDGSDVASDGQRIVIEATAKQVDFFVFDVRRAHIGQQSEFKWAAHCDALAEPQMAASNEALLERAMENGTKEPFILNYLDSVYAQGGSHHPTAITLSLPDDSQ